jgi:hypothetical protein
MPTLTASTFEYAAYWLANSPTFRAAMGVDYVGEAIVRIHREEVLEEYAGGDDPEEVGYQLLAERPLAIVIMGDDARERVGRGEWRGRGTLLVVIEALVPAEYTIDWASDSASEKQTKFEGRRAWGELLFQQIRLELMELSGQDDGANPFLNATSIERHLGPSDPEPGEPTDFLAFVYSVTWL